MADTEEANQSNLNVATMNGTEPNKGFEAEDIVADAIKLNVDDELNEQRYDNSSEKPSSFHNRENGNQSSLDNANIEDEPNYEIDENDQEQYLKEQDQEANNESSEQIESNSTSKESDKKVTDETGTDTTGGGDKKATETSSKNQSQDGKSNSGDKANETKNEQSTKDSGTTKKEDTETSSKSKSSSAKDKSSDHKSSSSIVVVSGISSSAKAYDLQTLFKKYGKVVSAKIAKNKLSGSKLFGLVTMENADQAELCIRNLHKTEFDGKTISVEKYKSEEKKSADTKDESSSKDKKDGEKSSSKRDRSRSRSKSPKRRFPAHRTGGFVGRRAPTFGFRGRGFGGPPTRPPFISSSGPAPMMIRKFEIDRLMRRRELRAKEMRMRAEDDYRRQKELERRQQDERDKLEREKLRIKYERERFEREKAEFMRAEREKARLERERLDREKEEFRRKQQQLPSVSSGRLDDLRTGKRYDDLYGGSTSNWPELDRKRSFSTSNSQTALASSTRYDDHLDPSLSGSTFANFSTYNLLNKIDVGLPAPSLRDSRTSSSGYDRDDRRPTANGSGLGYSSTGRSSLSSRDRETRRDDWKSSSIDSRRTDSRFLDSKPLAPQTATPSQTAYLSSTRSGYDRVSDWSSAPDRMPPASSLSKFTSSYASVSAIPDRSRVAANLPNAMGSTIGMYNAPMGGLGMSASNPSSYNSNLNTGHRRY